MRRIHRICQNKGYELTTNNVYSSIFAQSSQPELIIKADNKIYEIKFFACLKYNNTYTLSDLSSFITTDNTARIMLSFGIPSVSPGLPLRTREEQRLWNRTIVKTGKAYLKNEKKGATVAFSASEDTEKILCINPISVEIQAVHTNRPEKLFDGDKFKGCTVYSGKALCKLLEET